MARIDDYSKCAGDFVFYVEQGLYRMVGEYIEIRGRDKILSNEVRVLIKPKKIRWLRKEYDIVAM